jgi:predicted dehydrogenase
VADLHSIPKVYDSAEHLLDDPRIEVLDIAVPPNVQFGLIKAACERKTVKGILAQKPLGVNYTEAVAAVQLCEAAGIKLAVNQNMRYDQSVRAAKTLLDKATLGERVFATIEMRAIPHWMPWQKDMGWLTLRIMSIHHLDTFRYWFGEPEGIYCSIRTDPRTRFPHTDGICTYILEYKDGLRCVAIDDTWSGPAKEGCPGDNYIRWRIEGTNGLAIGDIGWCKVPFTSRSSIRYASKGDRQFHEPSWTESWFPDAFIGTMAQLLLALEDNTEPLISGRDNLKTMALVEAAELSAVQFRSVGTYEIRPDELAGEYERPDALRRHERAELAAFLKKFEPITSEADFQNFTPGAKNLISLACEEADRLRHTYIGTEHLLLGIIRMGRGVACNVLLKLGLKLETVRMAIEKRVGSGPEQKVIGRVPFTPRSKKALALAAQEAKNFQHTYIGTEHILLGLMREGDGIAAEILKSFHVDVESTRTEILRELDPNFGN